MRNTEKKIMMSYIAGLIFSNLFSIKKTETLIGDFEEGYYLQKSENGKIRAIIWYLFQVSNVTKGEIINKIYWSVTMLKSYLKISFRYMRRHKGFSFINVSGLTIGLVCCILIFMWVQDELTYDKFHKNSDSIYRIVSNLEVQPAPLAPYLKENYSEVINSARFYPRNNVVVKYQDKLFNEDRFGFADNSFLEMFTFPFVKENSELALTEPNSVVVTEETAKRYFGEQDPIGKVLNIENRFDFTVTGILENIPKNSQIQFDLLGSFSHLKNFTPNMESDWGNHAYYTYIQLPDNADFREFTPKITNVVQEKVPNLNISRSLSLQQFDRIHLYEDGHIKYVYIFSAAAFFILIIACINFVNLTTAQSANRVKEIGVRKVAGAYRKNLIFQFFTDSLFITFLSFLIAFIIIVLLLPSFNTFTEKQLTINVFQNKNLFLIFFGTAVLTGIISGIYPALLLSSQNPVRLLGKTILSGNLSPGGSVFRKIMVTAQFILSIFLIISTLIIFSQLRYIQNLNLGFDKENLLYLPVKGDINRNRETFQNELLKNPDIISSTFASSLPSRIGNRASGFQWEGMDSNLKPSWHFVSTDFNYIKTLGIEIIKGRNFSKEVASDIGTGFIVNEKAVEEMGINSPVGKQFKLWSQYNGRIIGVVKDFHFRPVHEKITPLLIWIQPYFYSSIIVKIKSDNLQSTIDFLKNIWDKYVPAQPFTFNFLDEAFDRNYRAEQKMSSIFKYFTFLAIFISCLGLFGLIAFVAEKRKKEIGIRKAIGAPVSNIVYLITREFLFLVVFANVIAWPVVYYFMKNWLSNFAYHTRISLWLFIFSGIAALLVAIITVSYKSVKAARANPVDSLRYE